MNPARFRLLFLVALGWFAETAIAEAAITYSVTFVDPGNANSASYAAITAHIQDPTLDLVDVNGVTLRSDNDWKESQQTEIEAASLAPSDTREAALVQTLAPGNYTAIVRGVGNTTGAGLVEVYNLQ